MILIIRWIHDIYFCVTLFTLYFFIYVSIEVLKNYRLNFITTRGANMKTIKHINILNINFSKEL